MDNKGWIILAVAAVALFAIKLVAKPNSAEKEIAKQKIKSGALVVDVRTADEYAGGHYENATNIPVQELAGRLGELGKDTNKMIVVYCAAGVRASQAKAILLKAGFKDVTNAGGLSDLKP